MLQVFLFHVQFEISIEVNPSCSFKRAALIYRGLNVLLVLVLVLVLLVLVLIPLKFLEKVHPRQFQDSMVDNPYKCLSDRLVQVYNV